VKKIVFISVCLILALTGVWIKESECQFLDPQIVILSYKNHPIYKNGHYFLILLYSTNTFTTLGLKNIFASNINPNEDPQIYEYPLSPEMRNIYLQFAKWYEFTDQKGIYKVTIQRDRKDDEERYANYLPPGLTLLPTPENLHISFESGNTTPTFSFDPVDPGVEITNYEIRIFDKDFSRRIYAVYLNSPSATFPEGRCIEVNGQCNYRSTAEDLIPGETYIFGAYINKKIPPDNNNLLQGGNFKTFKIPKKEK
jgi:hypothetical protein